MIYEKEQERLRKLWEKLEEEEDQNNVPDDEEDISEEVHVEEREEDSESEQELELESENKTSYQPPNKKAKFTDPLFIGKDKLTKWKKHPPNQRVKTRAKNIIIHLPGVKGPARISSNIVDIWSCFFTDEMLHLIVEHTNLSISQQQYRPEYRTATATDIIEIKALLGLLYLSAVRKTNHLNAEDLWKTNATSIELFRLTMSLERFRFLLRHLRFDNKNTRPERKKTDKLTVDEMLPGFRGNCNFRQYIPSKPERYGIKIFALVDAKTFYTLNMEVYIGKQPPGPFSVENSAKAVVERLVSPIVNTGRNITMDNWFTSLPLCNSLLQQKLTMIGTIKKNKRELPHEFVTGARPEGSSMIGFEENCTLLSYIPKKKNVLLISSMHDDDSIDKNTNKPEIIMMYNSTKSGVDTVDQLVQIITVPGIQEDGLW